MMWPARTPATEKGYDAPPARPGRPAAKASGGHQGEITVRSKKGLKIFSSERTLVPPQRNG
jgi:hypothetical protein